MDLPTTRLPIEPMNSTLAEFALLVFLGCAGLVVAASVVSRIGNARAERRALARRVVCRLCLHPFEDHRATDIVSCPACGVLNEGGGR